jgi:hypothetical protein
MYASDRRIDKGGIFSLATDAGGVTRPYNPNHYIIGRSMFELQYIEAGRRVLWPWL